MITKRKLKTPLIQPEPSLFSQSVAGVANMPASSIDDSSKRQTYQSFDTFIDNDEKSNQDHNDKSTNTDMTTQTQSTIFDMLLTSILFIIGSVIITFSIIAHQNTIDRLIYINSSYMTLLICIGSCFLFSAGWQLKTTCYYDEHSNSNLPTIYVFGTVSCFLSLILSIFAFLDYYNIAFTNNLSISYPFWLIIALISYAALIIFAWLILKILPPNHFKHFKISLPSEPLHKNAPDYIRKYTPLHPYDRSTIKEIWHSFTHQWLWNIIKLGDEKPLEIWDCYNVPQTDNIASQCKVWDNYMKQLNFDGDNCKFSTFKCVWQLEGRSFIGRCIIYMGALITSLAVPFLISALSEFYENKSTPLTVGIYLSLGLWCAAFVRIEIVSVIFTMTGRSFARCRAILIYVVYRKAIRLSTIGQKITMMGSDTRSIAWAFAGLHFLLANLLLVVIICLLLFYEIGYAAFIGWAFFILFTGPIQVFAVLKIL